ncbi:MAG: site-2 protease family protein [Chloroflexota bacterium]|nr:site-2 protease family protein [Chloroflexota bacterium]
MEISEQLTSIVSRVLKIDDMTTGNDEDRYLIRYRGTLLGDSLTLYDQLANSLRPYKLTPLFRKQVGKDAILLVQSPSEPKPSNGWINLALFIITLFSMVFGYAFFYGDLSLLFGEKITITALYESLESGVIFAISMLAILLAHEFGHYFAARYHKTNVTLPYFIPLPLSPLGTMGAFIRLKEPPKNKRSLLDIGITGPLAGLIVAIPILILGLSLSEVQVIDVQPGYSVIMEGNSIFYLLSKFVVFGQILPEPSSYIGLNPILYWVRYFFTGQPFPMGGLDVIIHPVAWAGWAGLLVTALNLIPAGQLDGGHVIFTLVGKKARLLWPIILAALILLGFVWYGWWIWAALIFLLGRVYAEPLDQITELDLNRRLLAMLGLAIFVLVFTPVPLMVSATGA